MTLSLARFSAVAAAALAVLCAAGFWPTSRMAGSEGVTAMAVAAGISLFGAIVGFLPFAMTSPSRGMEARAQAALIGLGVRLLVTISLAFAAIHVPGVPTGTPFMVWIGLDYAALLALETTVAVRAVRQLDGKGPASA